MSTPVDNTGSVEVSAPQDQLPIEAGPGEEETTQLPEQAEDTTVKAGKRALSPEDGPDPDGQSKRVKNADDVDAEAGSDESEAEAEGVSADDKGKGVAKPPKPSVTFAINSDSDDNSEDDGEEDGDEFLDLDKKLRNLAYERPNVDFSEMDDDKRFSIRHMEEEDARLRGLSQELRRVAKQLKAMLTQIGDPNGPQDLVQNRMAVLTKKVKDFTDSQKVESRKRFKLESSKRSLEADLRFANAHSEWVTQENGRLSALLAYFQGLDVNSGYRVDNLLQLLMYATGLSQPDSLAPPQPTGFGIAAPSAGQPVAGPASGHSYYPGPQPQQQYHQGVPLAQHSQAASSHQQKVAMAARPGTPHEMNKLRAQMSAQLSAQPGPSSQTTQPGPSFQSRQPGAPIAGSPLRKSQSAPSAVTTAPAAPAPPASTTSSNTLQN